MPEPKLRHSLQPLEVETRRTTDLLFLFTYAKRGSLTIASDHLLVGKGAHAVKAGKEELREATYQTDGFLGLYLSYWCGDQWKKLPLPYGVQQGLPVRDILGNLLINWGLTESVPGWTKMDRSELFPEQFKILRWTNIPHALILRSIAIPFFAGIVLLFMGQEYLATGLIFCPMFLTFLFYVTIYGSFCSRIVLSRDKLIIFPHKSPRLEFSISAIEQIGIEVDSGASGKDRKRLTLELKDGEKIPLCTYRKEWQSAEERLLDALRSRDVPIVVPGYE